MSIKERIKAPTPRFYKNLRNVGLTAAGVGTTILAAQVALPALLLKLASYLVVGGTVTSAVCQTVTGKDEQSAS